MKGIEITARGCIASVKIWAEISGLSPQVIRYRIRKGWHPDLAVTLPATNGNNQHKRY